MLSLGGSCRGRQEGWGWAEVYGDPPRAGSKAPGQAVGGGENRSLALSEEGVVRDLFWGGGGLEHQAQFLFLDDQLYPRHLTYII